MGAKRVSTLWMRDLHSVDNRHTGNLTEGVAGLVSSVYERLSNNSHGRVQRAC